MADTKRTVVIKKQADNTYKGDDDDAFVYQTRPNKEALKKKYKEDYPKIDFKFVDKFDASKKPEGKTNEQPKLKTSISESKEDSASKLMETEYMCDAISSIITGNVDLFRSLNFQGVDFKLIRMTIMENFTMSDITVLAALLALRGTQVLTKARQDSKRISALKVNNGLTILEIKNLILAHCTINQFLTCFADVACYALREIRHAPKLQCDLASFYQFFNCSGLPFDDETRENHKRFCAEFSVVCKTNFNEELYDRFAGKADWYDRSILSQLPGLHLS